MQQTEASMRAAQGQQNAVQHTPAELRDMLWEQTKATWEWRRIAERRFRQPTSYLIGFACFVVGLFTGAVAFALR